MQLCTAIMAGYAAENSEKRTRARSAASASIARNAPATWAVRPFLALVARPERMVVMTSGRLIKQLLKLLQGRGLAFDIVYLQAQFAACSS